MKFDKNRVYSAKNAGELSKGDLVFVADTLTQLRKRVLEGEHVFLRRLKEVDNVAEHRSFSVEPIDCFDYSRYAFVYLIRHISEVIK